MEWFYLFPASHDVPRDVPGTFPHKSLPSFQEKREIVGLNTVVHNPLFQECGVGYVYCAIQIYFKEPFHWHDAFFFSRH